MKYAKTLLLAGALLGCHNEPAPITLNQYFQQRADAVCEAVAPACLISASACVPGRVAEYQAEYAVAVTSGREFIPDNAEACVAKVKAVYGTIKQGAVALNKRDFQDMEAVCANVYRGSSGALGPCQMDADCLGNLICDKTLCGPPKQVPAGAQCGNIGEYCAPGYYCAATPAGALLCSPKVGLGGYCATSPCVESLRCSAGYCAARLDFSQPCTSDDDCATGFCEPYAGQCSDDIRFAKNSPACVAMSS